LISSKSTYQIVQRFLAVLALAMTCAASTAQTKLPNYIRENLELSPGVYTVTGVSYVQKEATLTIGQGVTLLFEENATIRVNGGLSINGAPNKLVNITSKDKNAPGNGIVINGVSTRQTVNVQYARFDYIKKPLTFEFRWSREAVNISHNILKRSLYEGAAIEVKEIDNLLTTSKILFLFKDNTFSNSTSSVLLSNLTSDLLTIDLENNVITRNEYTGRSRNGIFTSPLYMTYNDYQNNAIPRLQNNSIFDNFYSLYFEDTFNIGRTNVSVIGNANKLDLSGNYFGNPELREIEETLDFISANYQAPFLYFDNVLAKPSAELNGHFYTVLVNEKTLNENIIFSKYQGEIKNIEMRFNRPVLDGRNFQVTYTYVQADSILTVPVKASLKWSEGNEYARIVINEKLTKYGNEGYLEIDGLYDSEGMDVPILSIGKKGLIDPELRTYVPSSFANPKVVTTKDEVDVSPDDTLVVFDPTNNTYVKFEDLNDSFVHKRKNYWNYGVFIGNAVYFGDLNSSTVSINPRSMRPALGLRLGYQAKEKLSFNLRANSMIISGSDKPLDDQNKNQRGTNFERNMSFRTTILDVSLLAEYSFFKYKLKSTYVPSIHAGASVYYFNPQAKIEGDNEWYNLREIGTGGQTLDDGKYVLARDGETRLAYKKIMYGIPFGASVKRHITQKTIVSLSYTYNKIFTDYLDDVGADLYPDGDSLAQANPQLAGKVAPTLSNPGNQIGQRSYSDTNDGYGYWGLTFTFKIY
jgi:hypothetical protein